MSSSPIQRRRILDAINIPIDSIQSDVPMPRLRHVSFGIVVGQERRVRRVLSDIPTSSLQAAAEFRDGTTYSARICGV